MHAVESSVPETSTFYFEIAEKKWISRYWSSPAELIKAAGNIQYFSLNVNLLRRQNYCGCERYASTTDHVFCIRQILEKQMEDLEWTA